MQKGKGLKTYYMDSNSKVSIDPCAMHLFPGQDHLPPQRWHQSDVGVRAPWPVQPQAADRGHEMTPHVICMKDSPLVLKSYCSTWIQDHLLAANESQTSIAACTALGSIEAILWDATMSIPATKV